MISRYTFCVQGKAADGQSWKVEGDVVSERAGDFQLVLNSAMERSFFQLTRGKAVFGRPGVGCRGPYSITSLSVTLVEPPQPVTFRCDDSTVVVSP